MKLLIVLSIKEYQNQVSALLEKAGISIFSVIDMTGYKKREYNAGWFGMDNGKTSAITLFSFTNDATASQVLDSIHHCNKDGNNPFPVRGYIIDVEQFSDKASYGEFLEQKI